MPKIMNKLSKHDVPVFRLFCIVLFFLPVISFIGIGGDSNLSLSVADFFLPFLLIAVFYFKFYTDKRKLIKYPDFDYNFVLIMVVVILFIVLSMANIFRYDSTSSKEMLIMFMSVFKIFICILYAFCFVFFFQTANKEDVKGFIKVNAFVGFFFACTCILGVALYYVGIETSLVRYGFRATGTMEDPNIAATFLLMQMGYALLCYKISKKKTASFICIITMIIGVVMTSSKASVIILVTAGAITLFFAITSGMTSARNKILKIAIIILVLLLIIMSCTSIMDGFFDRLGELSSGDSESITTGRSELWTNAIEIALTGTNLIHGVGIGFYTKYLREFYPDGTLVTIAHNTYLSFLSETGIVIPIILFCIFGYLFFQLIKLIYRKKDTGALSILFGLMSVFIMMFAVNLQNNRMIYVYLIFSFFYIRYRKTKEKEAGVHIE